MSKDILRTNKSNKLRIVKTEYAIDITDTFGEYRCKQFIISYTVELKVLCFWFTIKEYSYNYHSYDDRSHYIIKDNYYKFCADKLYEHITKEE